MRRIENHETERLVGERKVGEVSSDLRKVGEVSSDFGSDLDNPAIA